MIQSQVVKTKFLAVMLSMWLVGLALACESICSTHHSEATQEASVGVVPSEIGNGHLSEHCPIAPALVSNLPARPSIDLHVSADDIAVIPATIQEIGQSISNHRYTTSLPPIPNTPFERLCALRI
jgi:hypothetical protein